MYCTPEDVRNTLAPSGADDESTAAEMDDDALTREIVRAQAEVDGHLADNYTVPFDDAEVPTLIKGLTEDVAAYLATLTHRRGSRIGEEEPIWLRYARASTLLERIGKSIIDLDTSDGDSSQTGAEPLVVNQYEDHLFARDRELGPIPTFLA